MSDDDRKGEIGPEGLGVLLCFAIHSADMAFNRLYRPLLERFGLTYPQYLVLVALFARDGLTMGELGSRLFLESSTLTPLMKRMEAAGLVRRERDSSDERVVRVTLASSGRELIQRAAECLPEELRKASGLDEAAMANLLERIVGIRTSILAVANRNAGAKNSPGVGEHRLGPVDKD